VKDGDDWVINGGKIFISGADKADYGIVFARTDASAGRAGITCFLVDTDLPGFHVRRVVHTLRSTSYATELQFDNLRVPAANVLGEVNKGFGIEELKYIREWAASGNEWRDLDNVPSDVPDEVLDMGLDMDLDGNAQLSLLGFYIASLADALEQANETAERCVWSVSGTSDALDVMRSNRKELLG
jgi:hypothetical protein